MKDLTMLNVDVAAKPVRKRPTKKMVEAWPLDAYHSQVIGAALHAVWNSIAYDLQDSDGSLERASPRKIIEICLDYLGESHLSMDGGLAHDLWIILTDVHGREKVLRWLTREHPLAY